MASGETVADELAVANAHTNGARPFARPDYVKKFETLTEGLASAGERARFLALAQRLAELSPAEVQTLTVTVDETALANAERDRRGIF